MPLKVDPVIAAAVTVQRASIPLDLAEVFPAQGGEIIGKDLELGQQVELEILGKGAHFRSADGIEDDLKHGGKSSVRKGSFATPAVFRLTYLLGSLRKLEAFSEIMTGDSCS